MSKKVLLINGSPRKKNTYGLLAQVEKILKERGIETEFLNLYDYKINDCCGCEACIYKNDGCECGVKDDMPLLKQKFMDSDGIVFGSPVYMRGVTSKLKAFADRTCSWFHKPEPAGKAVLFVTVTASTGIKETEKFYQGFATGFGARTGGFISRKENMLVQPVREKELSRFLSLLEKDKKEYRPKMNELVIFQVQKVLAVRSGREDKAFWEQKEWLDKLYYYKCKINLGKKLFSKMMFKILTKALNK